MTVTIGRRELLAALGGATVAWPLAAHAQQSERMRRIGVLMNLAESDPEGQARIAAFREGSPSWAGPRAATSRLNIAGSPASKSGRAPTRPNWCNSSRMSFLRVRHPHWRRCSGKPGACPSYSHKSLSLPSAGISD